MFYTRRVDVDQFQMFIADVRDKILTHSGSIELQEQLEKDPIILPSIILHEVEDNFTLICLDTYGNYVCQKLTSYLSSNQIYRFINCMSKEFELIATSVPGSCVLSSLISCIVKDDTCKDLLLKSIKSSISRLICDPQGSHLLQLVISLFEDVDFIFKTVKDNFFIIATDRYGCCLIKKIIEKHENDSFIFHQVCSYLLTLVNDQFGNYIIQYYFELGRKYECIKMIEQLLPEICTLSKQKYGSNVLETIIGSCDIREKEIIINLLTETEDKILELAQNRFGNYVLQKCLYCVEAKDPLYERTRNILNEIGNETIRQRIQERLK